MHDNGGNFTSKLLWQVLQTLGIHSITTILYHPQANGCVKRMHATLKKALKKAGARAKWISHIMFAMRVSPHETTGYSPFQLLFRHQPEMPISLFRNALEEPEESLPQPVHGYLKKLYRE